MERYYLRVDFDSDDPAVVDSILTFLDHTLPYMVDNINMSMAIDS